MQNDAKQTKENGNASVKSSEDQTCGMKIRISRLGYDYNRITVIG
jgi:hypothetical protein